MFATEAFQQINRLIPKPVGLLSNHTHTHTAHTHTHTHTHLNTPEPLLQLLYALLTISETEQGQVHGTLGVETLVSGVVDFLQDRTVHCDQDTNLTHNLTIGPIIVTGH